jgi:hypothetical protein
VFQQKCVNRFLRLLFCSNIGEKNKNKSMLALKYVVGAIALSASMQISPQLKACDLNRANDEVFEQAAANPIQNKDSAAVPRDGRYLIESFGYNETKPLKIGYFTLAGNEYKYYDIDDNLIDSGTYVFDASTKQIKWQTGRFKKIGWGGNFVVEQNGKTHTVHLNNTTVAKNTIP